MSILSHIDQDFAFLVVENKANKNQYCFKFQRKPHENFWFVSIQDGTWSEKYYMPIGTIRVLRGLFGAHKNKSIDPKYQIAFNCLEWIFENHDKKDQMELVHVVYGKINLV